MKYRGKSYHAWLLTSAAATAMMWAGSAAAEDAQFNIAPQPLASALNEFSLQSKQSVLFTTDLAATKASKGVSGQVEVADALSSLLAGTGLTWKRNGNTFLIVSASDPQSGSAAGDGADSGTVQALVVTAQKRQEDIQDVPIAISAFTQEDLTRSQVAGGPDLMTQVPNFTFTKTNFTSYSIQIRGIGTQAISATTDPAVAVAFNNTPFLTNHFFEQEFYDLDRVEVLRGPQGTLYGRNATAGVVNLISAKPKNHYEARLSGDVSNYSSSRLEGMINIPLIEDKAALRIAGAWTKRDGYVKNTLTGQQTDGRDLWSTRVTLGLTPTETVSANLIWEHFEENDDRLRSGKQMCHRDPTMNTYTTQTQGCLPASLYAPESFETPNGFALGYWGGMGTLGGPPDPDTDPYVSHFQSRNLREIETRIQPEYDAKADTVELQAKIALPHNLSLSSETGYARDFIFSFEDYNRFNTAPHTLVPGTHLAQIGDPHFDVVDENGFYCDPQLGCTDRLMAGDLATAKSRQFSQEFRLSSDFVGPFNFNIGANFLRYDTEVKYYVFINTITGYFAVTGDNNIPGQQWQPGVTDNLGCVAQDFYGPVVADPDTYWSVFGCAYIDPNDIHHLNDNGRNYFLSKNPYHLLSYAAFGEAYYNITPNLKLTAGVRWTVDKKTAPQIPTWLLAGPWGPNRNAGSSWGLPTRKVLEQEWREPTGRVALDWKPDLSFTDETLVYGSYVRGYKAGGANPPPPVVVLATWCPPECAGWTGDLVQHYATHPETFRPEFVDSYELGTKNTFLEGRLTANLSAFYYNYKDYQISYIVDRSAVNMNYDAKVWGGELEVDWRPLENLRFGFKGGYENTRVADGMKAIDLIDRTAGHEGWVVKRPFPTLPSNCVFPTWILEAGLTPGCEDYIIGLDPITLYPYVPYPTEWYFANNPPPPGYPGYNPADPANANMGEGFYKDLSGNQLPNAPKFTATLTADYTLPLPNSWLATLHTDLYYQSEAWTRIINTPGYDKLKAYTNMNLAAIFSNEDAGWMIMAYVKNVLDKDNITGAFLNSDDTGLTTNVFLNEPRLYGLRVTKNWTGGPGWLVSSHRPGAPYPLTLEMGAQMQRQNTPSQVQLSFNDAFTGTLNPGRYQTEDLDWAHAPELRLVYRREGSPWKITGGVRYGRTSNSTGRIRRQDVTGDSVCISPMEHKYNPLLPDVDLGFIGKLQCDPTYGPVTKTFYTPYGPFTFTLQNQYDPENLLAPTDRMTAAVDRKEDHVLVDFAVGKDVGLGMLGVRKSAINAGLRYADFKSAVSGDVRGIPDMTLPEDGWAKYNSSFHQYAAKFDAKREFKGAGPVLSWEASRPIWGDMDAGHVDLDWTFGAGALFGKQDTTVTGTEGNTYFTGQYPKYPRHWALKQLQPPAQAPLNIPARSNFVTVPVIDLGLGLSLEVPGVKLSTGYRWERYFNVLDAGFDEHKSYDRTIDGPYFKVSVGFGG